VDDATVDPKFGRVGKQKIENTGPLTRKRMETFELMLWPDGGYAPFRGEKGGTWEGGVRVPLLVTWPGKIKPGSVSNGIQNHEDLFATLAAAAGLPDLKNELLAGKKLGDTTYKVHLDGYNNLAHWTGESEKSARREIFYYDETDLMALRVDAWKMHIGVKQEGIWWNPKEYPSVPYLFNLLMDPMEKRAIEPANRDCDTIEQPPCHFQLKVSSRGSVCWFG
jgi:arylsulfatase